MLITQKSNYVFRFPFSCSFNISLELHIYNEIYSHLFQDKVAKMPLKSESISIQ